MTNHFCKKFDVSRIFFVITKVVITNVVTSDVITKVVDCYYNSSSLVLLQKWLIMYYNCGEHYKSG